MTSSDPKNVGSEPKNVVDLKQRQGSPGGSDRLGELLKNCRGIAQKRVLAASSSLFDNVDDALFDLAEKSGTNASQGSFFDGMREIRRKRQLVQRLFLERLSHNFGDFSAGRLTGESLAAESAAEPDGLSLVGQAELEESLAISSMAARAEMRLASPIMALNKRLSVLVGGDKVGDASNPVGPKLLSDAFRHAASDFEIAIEVRLIVLKLFERYVLGTLDPLYDELNTQLIEAGILPQLKFSLPGGQRRATVGARSTSDSSAPAAAPDGAWQASQQQDDTSARIQYEVFNTLRSLLAVRRGDPSGREGSPTAGYPAYATHDILSALSVLQSQHGHGPTMPAHSDRGATEVSVRELKQELMQQIERLTGESKQRVGRADEDTIELVSMMFEYILEDRNLPAEIQVQLGRLQIPYLKVALLDKHMFAQKSHPARRLLDDLAHVGLGWSAESDKDRSLFNKVKEIVETLLREFDDDVTLFERQHASLTDFMNSFKKRAQVAEQRAAEAARGREKLLAARRAANQTIRSAMESRRLPAAMMDLLSRPWSNVLVLIYLRQGPGSADWTEAVQYAEDLAWSGEPKTEVQQRLKLRNMLPALDKTLRKGLTRVAYHESDVKHLIGELGKCYRLLLDPGKGPTGPTGLTGPNLADQPPVSASVAPQPIPLSGDPGHLEGTPDEAGGEFELISRRPSPAAPPAGSVFVGTAVEEGDADEEVVLSSDSGSPDAEYLDDQFLALAKGLKVGTWLEFIDAEGNRERAKLSWISPISSKYLFVNRRGLKVADKTVYALAAEFRRKSAEVLENVPLFDRALDAIVERLKNRGEDEAAPGGSAPAPA